MLVKYPQRQLHGYKSIGYAQIIQYIDGKLSIDTLEEEIAKSTRRFAKRQLTFWRNEPAKRGWQEGISQELKISDQCKAALEAISSNYGDTKLYSVY